MINKKIRVTQCRPIIKEAVTLLFDAVSSTMGPGGQSVLMTTQAGAHLVTKDGVTVANALKSEDPEMDLIIRAFREAADKTNREAGDGTSTAVVLASAIYQEGLKFVETGHNVNNIKQQIQAGCALLIKELESRKIEITKDDLVTLTDIATISLNGDREIASLVAEANIKAGKFGVITVEDSSDSTSYIEKKEGIEINAGWTTPFFANDRNQALITHEDCYLFLTSYDLNNVAQLKKLEAAFSEVAKEGKALVVMAKEVSGGMLSNLLANNKQGSLKNVCVRSPYWGNLRREFMQDIAVLTGATVIEAEENYPLDKVRKEHFGKISRIDIGALKTRIIGKNSDFKDLEERVSGLKQMAEVTDKQADPNRVHERLAKLVEGITVIKIGRSSYLEGLEKKHRIEDSINACKAALEEGVLPGGGVALLQAAEVLNENIPGQKVLKYAVQMPLKTIAANSGHSGDVIIALINKADHDLECMAYNVLGNDLVEAFEEGILDPFKVTRTALENAVSVASTLLTTNVIISEIPEPVKPANPYEFYQPYN